MCLGMRSSRKGEIRCWEDDGKIKGRDKVHSKKGLGEDGERGRLEMLHWIQIWQQLHAYKGKEEIGKISRWDVP